MRAAAPCFTVSLAEMEALELQITNELAISTSFLSIALYVKCYKIGKNYNFKSKTKPPTPAAIQYTMTYD